MHMPTPQAVQGELAARGIQCVIEPVNLKTVWVGGFNRKWGLPLPQSLAIQSGSVLRLIGLAEDSRNALLNLLEQGIGERIEDGFGRAVLGWQQHAQLTQVEATDESKSAEAPLSDESKRLWSIMSQRLNKSFIADRASAVLLDESYTIVGNISRTQLVNLRSVIANALRERKPSLHGIDTYLTQIAKTGGRQFESARINSQSLSQWLKNPSFNELDQNITSKDRYVLQLIDLVLERAYRERKKRAQRGGN
jgi:CRISPR-associated protein Csx10